MLRTADSFRKSDWKGERKQCLMESHASPNTLGNRMKSKEERSE